MATAVSATQPDRIYVHQLNLTSADILRKRKEHQMMAEEWHKVKELREIKRRQREEEKKRDMEMLLSYNPWGKPGAGAPKDETKRKKFDEEPPASALVPQSADVENNPILFNLKFGRPGAGAPNRTQSGRIRTQIAGDPAIRFQDTQHVRLSIENQLRYKNEDKESYSKNLDELIKQRMEQMEKEKQYEKEKLEEMEKLYPFGRKDDNGGSKLSQTEPLFMATKPRRPSPVKEEFDPWGKGFGNPERDREGNVQRHKFTVGEGIPEPTPAEDTSGIALDFRRVRGGGAGAPLLTESGNLRTRRMNTLHNVKAMGPHIKELPEPKEGIYEPWGKPGAGAPFKREDGKPFEEKLGWSLTGHPKKRTREAKLDYMETLKKEMEEKKKKEEEEKRMEQEGIVRLRPPQKKSSGQGIELASVIRQGVGGRPKIDPVTGEITRNPIPITDVTSQNLDIRRTNSRESIQYHEQLTQQAAERRKLRQQQKEMEKAQSMQHLNTWESFWGRPGHGAPRDPQNHRKENLDSLLKEPQGAGEPYVKHYVTEMVPSKHKNRYEFPTNGSTEVVKKEYEFRTPWPAIEA